MNFQFTSAQLHNLAEQIEAMNQHPRTSTELDGKRVLTIDGQPVAFLTWHENENQFKAEFLDILSSETPDS